MQSGTVLVTDAGGERLCEDASLESGRITPAATLSGSWKEVRKRKARCYMCC
jgi:hypothetical protein